MSIYNFSMFDDGNGDPFEDPSNDFYTIANARYLNDTFGELMRATDDDSTYYYDTLPDTGEVMINNGLFISNPTAADYAAWREADAERYDTYEQSLNQLVTGIEQKYVAGGTAAEYNSLDVRQVGRRTLDHFLGIEGAGNRVLTDAAYQADLDNIASEWLVLPGTSLGKGEERRYLEGEVEGRDIALAEWRASNGTRGVPTNAAQMLELADVYVKMGVISKPERETLPPTGTPFEEISREDQGKISALLNDGAIRATGRTQRTLDLVEEGSFPALAKRATERGLESKTARALFITEEFQRTTAIDLQEYAKFMGEPPAGLNEQAKEEWLMQKALLAEKIEGRLKQGTSLFGANFVREMMMTVHQPNFTLRTDAGRKAAFEQLPADVQQAMVTIGYGPDNLEAFAHLPNQYSFMDRAVATLISKSGQAAREAAFRTGLHEGWANWTRRLNDTVHTDFLQDPTALYYTLPTLIAGAGTGLAVGVGAAGTTTGAGAIARTLGYTALDGLFAGAAEGLSMSINEQTMAFYRGNTTDIVDYSHVLQDAALYGGLGAAFGMTLSGGMLAAPVAFRATKGRLAELSHTMDEFRVNTGLGTTTSLDRAANRIAERTATTAEAKVAAQYALLNPGTVVRVLRGEVEALDVVRQSLAALLRNSPPEKLAAVEALFDIDRLERMGISALEAADLILQLQKKLGPTQTVDGDFLMNLINKYARRASRTSRYAGLAGKSGIERRVSLIDAALRADGRAAADDFVTHGGRYRTRSVEKARAMEAQTVDLARRAAAGEKLSAKERQTLAFGILNLNRRSLQDRLAEVFRRTASGDDLPLVEKFDQVLNGFRSQAKKIRKDKFLRKLLRVERALDLIDNEKMIQLAGEMGVSYRKLKAYANEMKQAYGNADLMADIDLRYQNAREAVERIDAEQSKAFDILEGPDSFNVQKFMEDEGVAELDGVREMAELRREAAKRSDAARRVYKDRPDELAAKLAEIRDELAPRMRDLAQKLGQDIDMDTAMERVVAQMDGTLPFKEMSDLQQGMVLERGLTQAADGASPDKISAGLASRDRKFLDSILEGTTLGQRLERMWSRMTLWGSTARALTRSDHRLIRGITQLITGQHIANRVHTNLMSYVSIDAAVESAKRVPLTFHLMRKAHRIKLGHQGNQLLGFSFNKLRMTGILARVDALTPENIGKFVPRELIDAYKKVGGPAALIRDLQDMQAEFTTIMTRAVEEAADAGVPMPKDVNPVTYLPHRVAGNISAEKQAQFVSNFRALREKQLLGDADRALDLEVLDSLGWIKITRSGGTRADGEVVNKTFVIPTDSPFYKLAGTNNQTEIQNWVRKNIIDKGLKGLESMDGAGTTASAPRTRASAVELADQEVNHAAIRQGEEVLRSETNPRYMTAEQNGEARTVADAVSSMDEELTVLERARSEIAKMDDATQRSTGTRKTARKLDVAIANRRRFLNQKIREAMASGDVEARQYTRMSPEQRKAAALDDETFSGISQHHAALVKRLDELVAQGVMDDASKRVIMAAFADVDTYKLGGMSFVRLDATQQQRIFGQASIHNNDANAAIVRLSDIANMGDTVDGRAVQIAETFVHEVAHISFLSAPAKMQRAFQALFDKVSAGHRNDIIKLFVKHGINPEHATRNVHEFVAYLSQISLVTSRTASTAQARTFMQKLRDYFVKLMKNVWLGDQLNVNDVADWDVIDRGVRAIFNQLDDDEVAQQMAIKYGVAASVQEYGKSAPMLRDIDQKLMELTALRREMRQAEEAMDQLKADIDKQMNMANSGKAVSKGKLQQLLQQEEEGKAWIRQLENQRADAVVKANRLLTAEDPDGVSIEFQDWADTTFLDQVSTARAGKARKQHLAAIDSLEEAVAEAMKRSAPADADPLAVALMTADLGDARAFLMSLDPRLTASMTLSPEIIKTGEGSNFAGAWYAKSGLTMLTDRGVRLLNEASINHTIMHEIMHHVNSTMMKVDTKFKRNAEAVFNSLTKQQRVDLIERLSAASMGSEYGIRNNVVKAIDPKTGKQLVVDGKPQFTTKQYAAYIDPKEKKHIFPATAVVSDYYADTAIEFLNEALTLIQMGRVTKEQFRKHLDAVKGLSKNQKESVFRSIIRTVWQYATNRRYLAKMRKDAQKIVSSMDGKGQAPIDEATLYLFRQSDAINDWDYVVKEAGGNRSVMNIIMDQFEIAAQTDLHILRNYVEGYGAFAKWMKVITGDRNILGMQATLVDEGGQKIFRPTANMSREEKVTYINYLMRQSGKHKGHAGDMMKLTAWKLSDEVNGTNLFYRKLEESGMKVPDVDADIAPDDQIAQAIGYYAKLQGDIEKLQADIAKLGDTENPALERQMGDLLRAREDFLESLNVKTKAPEDVDAVEAALRKSVTKMPEEDPPLPKSKDADPEDLNELVNGALAARQKSDKVRVGDDAQDAAFQQAVLKTMEEINESGMTTGEWIAAKAAAMNAERAADAAEVTPQEAFNRIVLGRAAGNYRRNTTQWGRDITDVGESGLTKHQPALDPETGEYMRDANGEIIMEKVSRGQQSMEASSRDDGLGIGEHIAAQDEEDFGLFGDLESPEQWFNVTMGISSRLDAMLERGLITAKEVQQYATYRQLMSYIMNSDDPIKAASDVILARKRQRIDGKMTHSAESDAALRRVADGTNVSDTQIRKATGRGGALNPDEIRALEERARTEISWEEVRQTQVEQVRREADEIETTETRAVEDDIDSTKTDEMLTSAAATGEKGKVDLAETAMARAADAENPHVFKADEELRTQFSEEELLQMWYDVHPPTSPKEAVQELLDFGYPPEKIKGLLQRLLTADSILEVLAEGDKWMVPQAGSGASFAREIAGLHQMLKDAKRVAVSQSEEPGKALKAMQSSNPEKALERMRPEIDELEARWADKVAEVETPEQAERAMQDLFAEEKGKPYEVTLLEDVSETDMLDGALSSYYFTNKNGDTIRLNTYVGKAEDGVAYLNPHFGAGPESDLIYTSSGDSIRVMRTVIETAIADAEGAGLDMIISHRGGGHSSIYRKLINRRAADLQARGWTPVDVGGADFVLVRSDKVGSADVKKAIAHYKMHRRYDQANKLIERVEAKISELQDMPQTLPAALVAERVNELMDLQQRLYKRLGASEIEILNHRAKWGTADNTAEEWAMERDRFTFDSLSFIDSYEPGKGMVDELTDGQINALADELAEGSSFAYRDTIASLPPEQLKALQTKLAMSPMPTELPKGAEGAELLETFNSRVEASRGSFTADEVEMIAYIRENLEAELGVRDLVDEVMAVSDKRNAARAASEEPAPRPLAEAPKGVRPDDAGVIGFEGATPQLLEQINALAKSNPEAVAALLLRMMGREPEAAPAARRPRLAGGDSNDSARPSDKTLRARYQADALARLDEETQELEDLFKNIGEDMPGNRGDGVLREGDVTPEGFVVDREFLEAVERSRAGGAGDGGMPPKPPKASGAAGDAPDPRKKPKAKTKKQLRAEKRADKWVKRTLHRNTKPQLRRAGDFNTNHRLASRDEGLADLYRTAVRGTDSSIYHPDYVADMRAEGFAGDISPLEIVAKRYVQHASGGFRAAYRGEKSELTHIIGQVSNPQSHMRSTFTDADLMDEQFGAGIADMLSTSTSPELLLQQYAEMTLGSIRIQKMLKDVFQSEGVTISDLFQAVEAALKRQATTDVYSGKRGRSLSRMNMQDISAYMEKLQEIYLRSRGINPAQGDPGTWGSLSKITRNLTYSVYGAKFAMSVLLVEAPKAILGTAGLNPIKIFKNSFTLVGSMLQGFSGQAMTFKPLRDFMAKFGMDSSMLRHTLEDMVYEFEQMQSGSFARHGLAEDETATNELTYNFIEKMKRHWSEVRGGPETTLLNRIESGTGAVADLTGIFSFMNPVTNAVRKIASNNAKGILLKHYPALVQLAETLGKMHEGGRFTTKEAVAAGRNLGLPRDLVVYMAHSGMLAKDGAILRRLAEYLPAEAFERNAAGRVVDMNNLQRAFDNARQSRRESGLGVAYDEAAKAAQDIDDEVLPALNQYLMYFIQEASPELRGAFRVQGRNPLTDLMFSLVTYPMAAYQALFANGAMAKGSARVAALAVGLSALEYMNRNVQRALHSNDEDERREAIRSLTDPKMTDMIDVIAQYGTSSPLFGQIGPYVKDIAGTPMANIAYDAFGVPSNEREKFWKAQPFSSPAIGMAQRLVGTTASAIDAGSKAVFGDQRQKERAMRSTGNLAKLGVEAFTPANNYATDFIMRRLTGGGLADHARAMFVTEKAAFDSGIQRTPQDDYVSGAYPAPWKDSIWAQSRAPKPQTSAPLTAPQQEVVSQAPPVQAPQGSAPIARNPSGGLADILNMK
jgi:hypothetical protein